jgi:hypothetical protein
MAFGSYPFRCPDCRRRFWLNIWLLPQLTYAKCPKCLRLELTRSHNAHHLTFWNNLLISFGARRYRCAPCRYQFLSFRPSAPACTNPDSTLDKHEEPLSQAQSQPGCERARRCGHEDIITCERDRRAV